MNIIVDNKQNKNSISNFLKLVGVDFSKVNLIRSLPTISVIKRGKFNIKRKTYKRIGGKKFFNVKLRGKDSSQDLINVIDETKEK